MNSHFKHTISVEDGPTEHRKLLIFCLRVFILFLKYILLLNIL